MMTPTQLGGPLSVIDDVSGAIQELRITARRIGIKLETALDSVPHLDTIAVCMPWMVAAIGFLGMAIILHAIKTQRR
ncbi:MAG: hypothetical protein ABI876_14155 [Bacteroidota bacterium]